MLDIEEIKKILPQRFPFLMIDRVIEIKENESLVALKNVTANENFFQGHFPEKKVMPGVLIIEAMAQASIIFFYLSKRPEGKPIYYLGKLEARFFNPVVPGDQLKIEVRPLKLMSKLGVVKTEAFVKDKLVASSEITFSVKQE
ncbi:MAG: 3-hydroxyacyl-ACP dehydratase FabZ [Candidatus Omnitrophota bacterium]|nr:3-hydroxyacyl-ACP dehydratase FabZ [Candidatus Omnitrophota bacterium]